MNKPIPPAGTPVDQKLYNEACQRITGLQKRNGELIDAILQHKIDTTPGSVEPADRELWNTIK